MWTMRHLTSRRTFAKAVALQKRPIHRASPDVQKEVKEITIPVPWGHIAGKWWGPTDVQPVIGLHGVEDNAGSFDNLAPLLNVDSFLAIDWPGHGYSSHLPPGRPYSLFDSILTLRRIIKHFNWDNGSMLGHSFGSAAIFFYTAMYPGSVRDYISIDCARTLMAPDEESEVMHMRWITDTLFDLEEKMKSHEPPAYPYDKIIDMYMEGGLYSATRESCDILMKRGVRKSAQPDKYYFARDPRLKYNLTARFPFELIVNYACNIRCNHLSIRGKQGFLWEGEKEEVYLKSVQNIKKPYFKFEHHDVEGTHHVHLNNAERIAPLVNRFLEVN